MCICNFQVNVNVLICIVYKLIFKIKSLHNMSTVVSYLLGGNFLSL
jgi:hypothetical protein